MKQQRLFRTFWSLNSIQVMRGGRSPMVNHPPGSHPPGSGVVPPNNSDTILTICKRVFATARALFSFVIDLTTIVSTARYIRNIWNVNRLKRSCAPRNGAIRIGQELTALCKLGRQLSRNRVCVPLRHISLIRYVANSQASRSTKGRGAFLCPEHKKGVNLMAWIGSLLYNESIGEWSNNGQQKEE